MKTSVFPSLMALPAAATSAQAPAKSLIDYFLPMEPRGPLVSEGIDVGKGQDRANDNHASKIVVVPFDGIAFDRDMQKLVDAESAQ